MMAMASSGTIVSEAAAELNTGIHAGNGAEAAMPTHVPKRISVQNANSAR